MIQITFSCLVENCASPRLPQLMRGVKTDTSSRVLDTPSGRKEGREENSRMSHLFRIKCANKFYLYILSSVKVTDRESRDRLTVYSKYKWALGRIYCKYCYKKMLPYLLFLTTFNTKFWSINF